MREKKVSRIVLRTCLRVGVVAWVLLIAGSLTAGCKFSLSSYHCDDFAEGKCVIPSKANMTYAFKLPAERATTWRKLGYYMYFHSRETPGVRVDFSKSLGREKLQILRDSLECSYRIEKGERSADGHIEGRRIDENGGGFWCFDYLGSMLIEFHKKYGAEEQKPDPDFFPITLHLNYKSKLPAVNGRITSRVTVRWTQETSP